MNNPSPNPSPLIPQGSLLEQKNQSRSRVKVAFFCVVGIHVVGLLVMLMQGCKREQGGTQAGADTNAVPAVDTNVPAIDTNPPPAVVASNPPPVEAIAPVTGAQEYVIQKGDTFDALHKKFNVSVKAIQAANPTVNPSKLQIGQKIVTPPPTAAAPTAGGTAPGAPAVTSEGGEQLYIVKSGDNLTKIAAQFGTTPNAIRKLNKLPTDKI